MPRENSTNYDEHVDLDEENDLENLIEEEVDYEEVDYDEVDYDEVEEEVEQIEDPEEGEERGNNNNEDHGEKGKICHNAKIKNECENKTHADLLALPPHGSEVYIGGIPTDVPEEDLRSFCESIGEVTSVKVVPGKNFAFVTFRNVELASKATNELNNTEFKGKWIKCLTAQTKNQLFIYNVPKNWRDEDLNNVVTKIGPGVINVKVIKDKKNSSSNRGYAFIDYYNHACADFSRKEMMNPKFKLDNNSPTVSWAESKQLDSSNASQVKTIYVKNVPKNTTEDQLKTLFSRCGKITRVVLPPMKSGQEKNRICFIYFSERSSALKVLENTEKYEIDGEVLECALAKSPTNQKSIGTSNSQNLGLLSRNPPFVIDYGFDGGAYGALGSLYGTSRLAQPVMYSRRPTTAGITLMPMLLPNGQIGYTMQKPLYPRSNPRNSRRSESRTSRGSENNDGSYRHRYHPY